MANNVFEITELLDMRMVEIAPVYQGQCQAFVGDLPQLVLLLPSPGPVAAAA